MTVQYIQQAQMHCVCDAVVCFPFSVSDLQLLLDTEKAEKQMLAEQLSAVEVSAHDL